MTNERLPPVDAESTKLDRRRLRPVTVRLIFFGIAGLAFLIFAYFNSLPRVRDQWTEFRSEAGRFTVLMPGDPTEKTEAREILGLSVALHGFRCRPAGGSEECDVFYFDYPKAVMDLMKLTDSADDEILDEIWKASEARGQNQLLDVQSVTLAGYSGREMTYERRHASASSFARCRLYVVDQRLYALTYQSWRQPRLASKEAETFFTSFKLTGKVNKAPARPPRAPSSCRDVSE